MVDNVTITEGSGTIATDYISGVPYSINELRSTQ